MTCAQCKHRSQMDGRLVCKRFPPVPVSNVRTRHAQFPVVRGDWDCSEFELDETAVQSSSSIENPSGSASPPESNNQASHSGSVSEAVIQSSSSEDSSYSAGPPPSPVAGPSSSGSYASVSEAFTESSSDEAYSSASI